MQIGQLKRRDFITLLGGAAAWPLAARAQQSTMPVVGFIHILSPEAVPRFVPAFRQGLKEVATSRAKTWRSNTAGRKANTIDCPGWSLIWCADKSP